MYVGDTDIVNKSQKELLKKAKYKLNKLILRDFKDSVGRYAFEVDKFVVACRSYLYGYIVSVHKQLVNYAKTKNKKILVYFDDVDKFYMFDPIEIEKFGTINRRGEEEMINFDIKNGVFYEPI